MFRCPLPQKLICMAKPGYEGPRSCLTRQLRPHPSAALRMAPAQQVAAVTEADRGQDRRHSEIKACHDTARYYRVPGKMATASPAVIANLRVLLGRRRPVWRSIPA